MEIAGLLVQSRETHGKLKPNYPRQFLESWEKVFVFSPSLSFHALGWQSKPEPFWPILCRSRSPFVSLEASDTTRVGNAVCEPASTPSLFRKPQRAEPQKGSVWPSPALHLACTFPIQPLFPLCTTELLQNSFPPWQQTQWPRSGWFSSSWRFFLDDFTSPALRANSTRVSYCMSSWFLHSSLPSSLYDSWHMPKFVEGISVTSVFHQLPWDFSVLFWRVKRNFIHDLAEDTWSRVGLGL